MSTFTPPLLLRNAHLQTVLATQGPRQRWVQRACNPLLLASREVLLDCGNGVRLAGYHTPGSDPERSLVTLIHGWEGSASSTYLLSAARALHRRGHAIFRLNLRDHGATHHLNRDPFTSTRLDEVLQAVAQIHARFPAPRQHLVGFSLGGNFALRIALRAPAGLPLARTIAVCPVVRPHITAAHLESGPALYHRHFLRHWKRSLALKLELFPELAHSRPMLERERLTALTEDFVRHFTDYPSALDYFRGYAIDGDTLAPLQRPCHIIASRDDPVTRVEELAHLAANPQLGIEITRYGGHCGFLQDYRLNSWLDARLPELLS